MNVAIQMDDEYVTIHRSEYEKLKDQDKFLDVLYTTDIPNSPEFQVAINRWLSLKDENYVA